MDPAVVEGAIDTADAEEVMDTVVVVVVVVVMDSAVVKTATESVVWEVKVDVQVV